MIVPLLLLWTACGADAPTQVAQLEPALVPQQPEERSPPAPPAQETTAPPAETITAPPAEETTAPPAQENPPPRAAAPPPAARPQPPPAPPQRPEIVLPPLDPAQKTNYDENGMRRIGVHRDLPAPPKVGWTTDDDGAVVWRIQIRSPAAVALRLHFTGFQAGAGRVIVQESDPDLRPASVRRYEGRGPAGDGEFWSDILEGEAAIVEYRPANGAGGGEPPFRIDKISHLWQSPLDAF